MDVLTLGNFNELFFNLSTCKILKVLTKEWSLLGMAVLE